MLYNIDPKKWGESYWKMSHYITFAYPDFPTNEDKFVVKTHFENLKYLLPCANCRAHYSQHLTMFPLTDSILESRYKLIKWLVDLHNQVNKRNGKKEYSINEVIQMYSVETNNISFVNVNSDILQILFLFVLIVCLVIYVKNKQD